MSRQTKSFVLPESMRDYIDTRVASGKFGNTSEEPLEDDSKLAEAFHALTPGRQKGDLLHFAGAKQAATRSARVGKHAPRILAGLGFDDEE